MAVFVHNTVTSVSVPVGGPDPANPAHEHSQEDSLVQDHRTFGIECSPECEAWIMAKVDQSANSPKGVPLTPDEQAQANIEKEQGNLQVATMARALSKMAEDAARAEPVAAGKPGK